MCIAHLFVQAGHGQTSALSVTMVINEQALTQIHSGEHTLFAVELLELDSTVGGCTALHGLRDRLEDGGFSK